MRVVILALSGTSRRTVIHNVNLLLERNVDVTVITTNRRVWDDFPVAIDPRIELRELREGEGRHLLPRSERVALFVLPRLLFRLLVVAARSLRRLPQGQRVEPLAVRGVEGAERLWELLAGAFHNQVFLRFYRLVRPIVLSGVAQRGPLSDEEVAGIDVLLMADTHGVPLGWELARRHPELRVVFSLDGVDLPPVVHPSTSRALESMKPSEA